MTDDQKTGYFAHLLFLLNKHFNDDELRTLCFALQIDYETLPAQGKQGKARELIEYMNRLDRLDDLVAALEAERPNINWRTVSTSSDLTIDFHEVRFPANPIAALVVQSGPTAGSWIFLTEQSRKVIFGRQADVSFNDARMSKKQFTIVVNLVDNAESKQRNHRVELVDMGSTNGTFIDGVQLEAFRPVVLHDGAMIQAGGSRFLFKTL